MRLARLPLHPDSVEICIWFAEKLIESVFVSGLRNYEEKLTSSVIAEPPNQALFDSWRADGYRYTFSVRRYLRQKFVKLETSHRRI